jgi:hypothetical protein
MTGRAFFVRQAYFLGADDPFDKLKRALRADIDEEACEFVPDYEPPVPEALDREGRHQDHQSLWRRGVEGC